MLTSLLIEVTLDNVCQGERKHSQACPLALAFKDALKQYFDVHVSVHPVLSTGGYAASVTLRPRPNLLYSASDYQVLTLPDDVQAAVKAYDNGAKFQPMSFVVRHEPPSSEEYLCSNL